MGLLKNLISGMGKNKEEFKMKLKEAQEEDRIIKIVNERNKSANERDLEKRLEQKRQDKIKMELDRLRKKDNQELWKSKKTILSEPTTMLRDERPMLKEKNIFMDDKTKIPFTRGGENMFFKW